MLKAALLASQAIPTASTPGSLFVGVGYVRANPDYSPAEFEGWSVFVDANLWKNFGLRAMGNHTSGPQRDSISERSYEVGLRGRMQIGPIVPFLDIAGGLGSFTYMISPQNGSYALYAGGGGVDIPITRKFLLRGEYDSQRWNRLPAGPPAKPRHSRSRLPSSLTCMTSEWRQVRTAHDPLA